MTREEPRPISSPLTGGGPRPPQGAEDGAVTEQLKSEMDQQHEESALDRDGEVKPERPVNSGRSERRADRAGIEIDHAKERPQD